jgi:AcrR family transcriptional regulator
VTPVKRRSYDNSRREAAAQETKRAIVAAARELFIELGYPTTTFVMIAERSEVSVQTVYAHFPTKRSLLKQIIDESLVGDDEPVPVIDRPEVAEIIAEPDPVRKVRLHAAHMTAILERAAPLEQVLRSAATVDTEIEELWQHETRTRRAGMRHFADHLAEGGHLKTGLSAQKAADQIAVLIDPELYRMTVGVCGWKPKEHERWLAELLASSLLPSPLELP